MDLCCSKIITEARLWQNQKATRKFWWHISVQAFAEGYDFGGKTIVPFATSGSSGIGESGMNIGNLAKDAHVFEGRRFAAGASAEELKAWAEEYL